jgi:hypothetical protein
MRGGWSCGRFARSVRELLAEFHSRWKGVCTNVPSLSTGDALDSVDKPVQDVETVWVLAAALLLATPAPRLDPQHLPPLPSHGLIRQDRGGVVLETLHGAPLGRLAGLQIATLPGMHGVLAGRRGRLFVVDPAHRRLRRVSPSPVYAPAGCRFTDAWASARLFVCGRTIKRIAQGRLRIVARAPSHEGGAWQWAEYAPAGGAILAQWLGLCESPTAFVLAGGRLAPYGARSFRAAPESFALGWLAAGRAVVHFRTGVCGRGYSGPGVYAVPLRGRPRLLKAVPQPALYAMWGG